MERYRNEDKPYFMYLSYQAPHDPLHAWPEDVAKYAQQDSRALSEVADEDLLYELKTRLCQNATLPAEQLTNMTIQRFWCRACDRPLEECPDECNCVDARQREDET